MKTLTRLAWRNIWRQKRRTILLVIVVAYTTLSTIFFWGMTEGQNDSLITNQARYLQAPAMLQHPLYQSDSDPNNALPSLDLREDIASAEGVRDTALRLELFGVLRSPYTNESVMVRGIEPDHEPSVSNIPKKIATGQMLTQPGEVVLGEGLAERLDVRLGERVALDVSALAGAQALGLILVGTVDTNVAALDQTTVLIHLDDARTLSGVPTATAIALDIARGQEDKVAQNLANTLDLPYIDEEAALTTVDPEGATAQAPAVILGLSGLMGSMNQMIRANTVQMIPVLVLFALFAALAVTSTLFVSVLERQREFGMMSAIGTTPPRLARMIVLEAVATTIVGWLVGLALGYALTYWFSVQNIFGQLFAATVESFAEFGMSDEMYTTNKPIYAAYAALSVVFALLFALLVPAWRVLRMNPAQAMRE